MLRSVASRAAPLSPDSPPHRAMWAATLHAVSCAASPRSADTCSGLEEMPHLDSAACSPAMHSPEAYNPVAQKLVLHNLEARTPASHSPVAHGSGGGKPVACSPLSQEPLEMPLRGSSPAAAAPSRDVAVADAVVTVSAALPEESSGQVFTQLSARSPPGAVDRESSLPTAAFQGLLPPVSTIGRDDLLSPSSSPPVGATISHREPLSTVLPPRCRHYSFLLISTCF